nr:FtsX-like permease family protein [Bacteroidaceae bacterium]
DVFRIMKLEKLISYIFLTFILLIACFNVVGSLSMLIIDKKKDVITLRHLGASDRLIGQIFLLEGRLISLFGALIGIVLGVGLCLLQQHFGFITLGAGAAEGAFVIDAYPVQVEVLDVFLVLGTVLLVGWIAVWYPVKLLTRKLIQSTDEKE